MGVARHGKLKQIGTAIPEKDNSIFYPLFTTAGRQFTDASTDKKERNEYNTPNGKGVKRTTLQKSPTISWDNADLNCSIDLKWDEASQRSVKKAKRNCGSQVPTLQTTEKSNESETARINLARKFRKLLSSLDIYTQQLLKDMDENPKTKLTTKSKASEIRSVVTQMCTVSMKAMLEDLEAINVSRSRGSSRCATDCATQTYKSTQETK